MMPWQIVFFACLCNGICLTYGVFSKHYKDNLFQRIGMALLAMISLARVNIFWNSPEPVGLIPAWFHVGLWFFTIGTTYKLFLRYWAQKYPVLLSLIDHREDDRHVPQ